MPSLRIVLGLTALTLLQFASATPVPAPECAASPPPAPATTATPTRPLSGGTTELPDTTLAFKYVLIGRGIQNYTCASASAVPVAIGAIATLYDATEIAKTSPSTLHAIPPKAVYYSVPAGDGSFKIGSTTIAPIGHHYFDALGTPTFDLSTVGKILRAGKTAGIPAPATADKGPAKTGAVDWLYLTAKTTAPYNTTTKSVGLGAVYRLVTAGGVAKPCTAAGVNTVEYASEYWMYG